MLDIIEGVSLLLFGLLLIYLGVWGLGAPVTWQRALPRALLAVWGGVLVGGAIVDALVWLSTVSVCIRCGG